MAMSEMRKTQHGINGRLNTEKTPVNADTAAETTRRKQWRQWGSCDGGKMAADS